MTASRDPDRLIHAFLVEGQYELADRVYDVLRGEIDATRQRAVIVPWRTPAMPTFAKLAITAAAVVVVAVIGISLLAGPNSGVGGGPTPTPAPTPTPTLAPTPIPTEPGFAPSGPLAIGRHTFTSGGLRFSVDVQDSGWISNGEFGMDRGTMTPDGAGFIFWPSEAAIGVYADPCGQVRGPVIGPIPSELAAAVAALPGTDLVDGPTDVTVGGFPAKHVAIRIRDDIGCSPEPDFAMWYGATPGDYRYASELGGTINTWIVDVDGTIAWIDGETFRGAGPVPQQLLQQIVDSIQFE